MTKTEILYFLYLKYFPVVYLANDRCLCYYNEIIVNLHFHDAVDCFNGYFLKLVIIYLNEVIGSDFGYFFARLILKQTSVKSRYTVQAYSHSFYSPIRFYSAQPPRIY